MLSIGGIQLMNGKSAAPVGGPLPVGSDAALVELRLRTLNAPPMRTGTGNSHRQPHRTPNDSHTGRRHGNRQQQPFPFKVKQNSPLPGPR